MIDNKKLILELKERDKLYCSPGAISSVGRINLRQKVLGGITMDPNRPALSLISCRSILKMSQSTNVKAETIGVADLATTRFATSVVDLRVKKNRDPATGEIASGRM